MDKNTSPASPTTRPKKKQDPTMKAMGQLDRMFEGLTDKQISVALNWAIDKHSSKNIKALLNP